MHTNSDNALGKGKGSSFLRLSSRSVSIAGVIAAMTAMTNALWVTFHLIGLDSRVASTLVIVQVDPSVSLMHIRIALALLLATACLWYRRVGSLLISALAFLWVLVEYGRWYVWSVSIRREAGVASLPGILSLYGANAWNVAVVIIVFALIIWQIRILGSFWMPRRR